LKFSFLKLKSAFTMNGKIILGLAGTVVTVASALAFKAQNGSVHQSVGKTANGGLCRKCASLWSIGSGGPGGNVTKCNTKAGGGGIVLKGVGSAAHSHTWFTQTLANHACPTVSPVVRTKVTTTN
jgi:hypothetical protein